MSAVNVVCLSLDGLAVLLCCVALFLEAKVLLSYWCEKRATSSTTDTIKSAAVNATKAHVK